MSGKKTDDLPGSITSLPDLARYRDIPLPRQALDKAVARGELKPPRFVGGIKLFSKEDIIDFWRTLPTSRPLSPQHAERLRLLAEAGRRAYAESKAARWRAKAEKLEREAALIRANADAIEVA